MTSFWRLYVNKNVSVFLNSIPAVLELAHLKKRIIFALYIANQYKKPCMKKVFLLIATTLMICTCLFAQGGNERVELIKYGDMEHWVTRYIHESAIIGGETKTLYEIGPTKTIDGNIPYRNAGGSPWGTSNVMAKVSGIVKTNNSVYRDRNGSGWCARMETRIEKVKVLGMINISVLAAGSIYLGDMTEPVTGTKDGPKALNWGVRFDKRPKAVRYDYKVRVSDEKNRIKQNGFSRRSVVEGKDCAIAVLLLQKRKEDAEGRITALRVGTMVVKYDTSTDEWNRNVSYYIMYGDIRNNPKYDSATMALRSTDYARNSKGRNVPIQETGWALADETPTHLVLQFSSSHGGAYIGSPGNTLWVDNVRLVY